MNQPRNPDAVRLTCVRPGCAKEFTVNREELDALEADSAPAYCADHQDAKLYKVWTQIEELDHDADIADLAERYVAALDQGKEPSR